MYHDHDEVISDHIGGQDNFYNHSLYTGWQHWGQVIGNPLFLSPIYNSDQTIEVKNNRSNAFHFGFCGDPVPGLHYRVLGTYLKGWGTYNIPYTEPRKNFSLLSEITYTFANTSKLKGWSMRGALGMDFGKLLGDNYGVQLTIAKTGIIKRNKK